MSDALVSRSGLLTCAHNFLRTAARDTYLTNESPRQTAHRQLAGNTSNGISKVGPTASWTNSPGNSPPPTSGNPSTTRSLNRIVFVVFNVVTNTNCSVTASNFDLATSYKTAFALWSQNQPETLILALLANQVASLMRTAGCDIAAEPLMRRALAIDEQYFDLQHTFVAIRLNFLGGLLSNTNPQAEAEPMVPLCPLRYRHLHPRPLIRARTPEKMSNRSQRLGGR